MVDLAKQPIRSRFEARILDSGAEDSHAAYGERKTQVIGAMSGTVVELGPGTGVNMRYYSPGTKVIAIEPNPVMHAPLIAKATEAGIDLDIRTLHGESVDVADASVDGVVGTLLLCGVDDPHQVVAEAYRILRPGGTYFFVEHVEAPAGSRNRQLQRVLRRPHHWLFNGCNIMCDTAAVLHAGPFAKVTIDPVDRGRSAGWVRHQLVGTAVKA